MSRKQPGYPLKTGGSGAQAVPHGGGPGVGVHKPSEGTERIGTVPADANQHDPNFGRLIDNGKD